ncbi:MAG TPA: HAD family hydrolase [Acidimicrobiia bacterium]|nr:HAD family hydrolase [Acidimicrobiia bacterium]
MRQAVASSRNAGRFDAVLLDAGGVLVLPHHDVLADHALRPLGINVEPEALNRALYESGHALGFWPVGDDPVWEVWTRAYLRSIGIEPGDEPIAILMSAFKRLDMWTSPAPGVAGGLRAIAATGVKIAVVSNADGQVEADLARLGVCQVGEGAGVTIDAVVDSSVVGVAKPDPRIFHLTLERLGVAPERAVHVGDIIGADVAGATAAGVHPVHFDPYGLCGADDHDHAAGLTEIADLVGA